MPTPSSYGDLSRPPLSARSLAAGLVQPGGLWTELRVLDRVGSTNAVCAAAARDGAPEGLVVVAEEQTAGRGRLDRTWVSPPRAGLTLSLLLRPQVADVGEWGWLPLLAGLAVLQTVSAVAGLRDVSLKWPNDVLAGSPAGKLAGLLAEVPVPGAVVIGLGLNVSSRASELPPGAASLATLGAETTDRATLLRALLRELAGTYDRWQLDPGGVRGRYREVCGTIGRFVTVERPGAPAVSGLASAVDDRGRLVVDDLALPAGDVVHVR